MCVVRSIFFLYISYFISHTGTNKLFSWCRTLLVCQHENIEYMLALLAIGIVSTKHALISELHHILIYNFDALEEIEEENNRMLHV